MPRADLVASALSAGLQAVNEYDSANGTQLNSAGMESNSVVPVIAVVTIATRIANALPLVAYLPNSNGSNEVPIVYGRNIAKNTFGEVVANDFLDGATASRQYFDPQFEFVETQDALPFMGGRVRVYVNGVEVANDATVNHAKFDGISSIIPVLKHNLKVKDANGDEIEVKLQSGEVNLTKNTVEIIFATDTAIFNNTSDQARELLVTISSAKVIINKILDVVPSGHDIYVSDKMSVLFDNLADDTHYRKISSAVGAPNQITRIGTIDGNINVYHVPSDANLLTEVGNAAEIMVVGRSGEAVRNPFVSFVATPMTVRESNTVDFEEGVTIQANQASELNPLERFADQCVVIQITNLPVSVVSA